MLARILRKYGTFYAGQILSHVKKGDLPADVAEYFEDDDPAVVGAREPGPDTVLHTVNDDEVLPLKGSDFAKGQEAKVKAVKAEQAAREASETEALGDVSGRSKTRKTRKARSTVKKVTAQTKKAETVSARAIANE